MRNYTAAVEHAGFGLWHYRLFGILALVHACDAAELLSLSFVISSAKSLAMTGTQKGLLSAGFYAGMLAGGTAGGSLADRYGRKAVMAAALGVDLVFGLAAAFAPTYWTLAPLRWVEAAGVGAVIPLVFTLGGEVTSAQRRERWLIAISMTWAAGALASALLAYAIIPSGIDLGPLGAGQRMESWRVYLVACALISAVALATVLSLLDESPRWLMRNGREQEAAAVLARMRRGNDPRGDGARPDGAVEGEILALLRHGDIAHDDDGGEAGEGAPLLKARRGSRLNDDDDRAMAEAEREALAAGDLTTFGGRARAVFSGSFAAPSLLLLFIWFGTSLSFYGYITWLPSLLDRFPSKPDVYATTIVAVVCQLPGSLVALYAVPRVGAHRALVAFLVVASVSIYLLVPATTSATVVALGGIFMAAGTGAWNSIVIATTAEYPTLLRGSAWGILAASGRAGAISSTLIIGQLGRSLAGPLTFISVGALCAAAAAAALVKKSRYAHVSEDAAGSVKTH